MLNKTRDFFSSLKNHYQVFASSLLVVTITLMMGGAALVPATAVAAIATPFTDYLITENASTQSNHDLRYIAPTGVSSGQTIVFTYNTGSPASSFTGGASVVAADVAINKGAAVGGSCLTTSFSSAGTVVASGATSSQWNLTAAAGSLTLTSGGSSATVSAGQCVQVTIANHLTNGSAGLANIQVSSGTGADTNITYIPIIANDVVNVTASVAASITFSLSTNNVDFGALTTGSGRWAKSGASSGGTAATATTMPTPISNSMTVATNAPGGYTISYYGDTLKSGTNSISAATISADSDGTPGTSQFAASYSASGSATIPSAYSGLATTTPNWSWVPNTTTVIATNGAPVASETINAEYLANIATTTATGNYSTNITYIATGAF